MSLSPDQRRYLKEFEKEFDNEDSTGWLHCDEAARRSKVSAKAGKLAQRFKRLRHLEQRKWGEPDFALTPRGKRALHPWRDRTLVVTVVVAVIGWILFLVKWLLG